MGLLPHQNFRRVLLQTQRTKIRRFVLEPPGPPQKRIVVPPPPRNGIDSVNSELTFRGNTDAVLGG